jgi:hypothetical protein
MPLIYGDFLAGALLTCLVPIALLICFAIYFYWQARRQTIADANQTTPEAPPNPGQPLSNQ